MDWFACFVLGVFLVVFCWVFSCGVFFKIRKLKLLLVSVFTDEKP